MKTDVGKQFMQALMFSLGLVAGLDMQQSVSPIVTPAPGPIEIRTDSTGGDVASAYLTLLARQLGRNDDFPALVRDTSKSGADLQAEWIKRSTAAHGAAAEVVDAALEARVKAGDRDALAAWINDGVKRWREIGGER